MSAHLLTTSESHSGFLPTTVATTTRGFDHNPADDSPAASHRYQWTPVDRVHPGDIIRIGGTGTAPARVVAVEPRNAARTGIEYRYLSGDQRPVWLLFNRTYGGVYVERHLAMGAGR